MSHLRFSLFGNMRVTREDRLGEQIRIRPAAKALLAYLLLHRSRSHSREVLAGIFWGDMDEGRAKRCLNTTLWRLRRTLKTSSDPECCVFDTVTPGEIQFNQNSDVWIDVAEFEHKIVSGLAPQSSGIEVRDLEEAHQLYVGELMEGYYEDWVLRERERLRDLYLKSLASLMKFYQLEGHLEKSLKCGQNILEIDPLREEVCRAMMRMYVRNGQRNLAIHQYKVCCETLETELNIAPMLETQALYQEIMDHNQAHAERLNTTGDGDRADYKMALDELNQAVKKLEMAQHDMHHVLKILSNLAKNEALSGRDPQSRGPDK